MDNQQKQEPELFTVQLKVYVKEGILSIDLDKPRSRDEARDEIVAMMRDGVTLLKKENRGETFYPAHSIEKVGIKLTPVKAKE